MEEIQKGLRQMENRKATGLDGVNTLELLKYGGTLLELRLLYLLNECWRKAPIPAEWIVKVVSLFKKETRSLCANYRRIGLLNTAYKLYSIID